jgi:hypothetical protein
MQIIWNEESWMPCVYANTHPISFLWFVAKGDMRCTNGDQSFFKRYMLQQIECWTHWKTWNEYRRDNMQTWDDIPSIIF